MGDKMEEYKNKKAFFNGLRSTIMVPEAEDLIARISEDPKYKKELEAFSNKMSPLTDYYIEHEKDFSKKEKKYIEDIFRRRSGVMRTITDIVTAGAVERLRKASEKSEK